jgi:hypothetical protein
MTELVTYIDGLGPAGYIYFSSVYIVAEVCIYIETTNIFVYVCVCVCVLTCGFCGMYTSMFIFR